MVIMQHSSTNLLAKPPHLRAIHASATGSARLDLPSRNVTAITIEQAFVQFIFSCNPGVPVDTDTTALREAFRTPPKSGGKSFSTWTLFELIAQFQSKEIKTWADLALKLGVEPPDQDKGQSSQKIQQYAVRLKRWMHSMHVDAFFEYLLNNPHPYWTEIPLDPNPVSEGGRDGVAAEDDMALRSLLPHIRPRRGRKRPDDDSVSRSPSQKPKMEPGSDQINPINTGPIVEQHQLDLWTDVQPDARSGTYLFTHDHFNHVNMGLEPPGPPTNEDFTPTPMTAQPFHTVTPGTAGDYWPEHPGNSRSSTTPTKPKTSRRHGAKAVSSAWRSGGSGGSGKTRGRPPLKRQTSQTNSQGEVATPSFPSFPSASVQSASPPTAFVHASLHHSPQVVDAALQQDSMVMPAMDNLAPTMTPAHHPQHRTGGIQQGYRMPGERNTETHSRRLKQMRSGLSLQVPETRGAEVRLATPQGQQQVPAVVVNGEMTAAEEQASIMVHPPHHHQSFHIGTTGPDMHMMDPFSSGAAQDMYSILYQQETQQHHKHQHYHPPQIQHVPQTSQDNDPLYAITTTSTHCMTSTHQPASLTATTTTRFHHPTPASLAESTSADIRPADVPSRDMGNRTNLDSLEALLTYELLGAEWTDVQGDQIATCGIDEAGAVAREVVENARRVAGSAQGFLMNVAAIAGVRWLRKPDARVQVQRMGMLEGEREVYDIHWELQLGDVRSGFSLREVVAREWWVRQKEHDEGGAESEDEAVEGEENEDTSMRWRRKYRRLLGVVQDQNDELSGFRQSVVDLCRPRSKRRNGQGGEVA